MNNNTVIPSLASVMTSLSNEVMYQKSNGFSKTTETKNWAEIRTARMDRSVSPNLNKLAQMGGAYINNTTTQPNFYSPFLTPSSFQIPNTRKEIYLWANWWRNNEPKVAAGINFYRNFPFNGWRLECKSAVIKDYFEKLIQKLNFQKWLPEISNSYHLYGDAFVFATLDCPQCNGQMENPNTGEPCEHKGATWKSLSLLNPDSVEATLGFMDSEPVYAYLPTDREVKIVMERQPEEFYNAIPDEVKQLISRKQKIKLNNSCLHHFKHGADSWSDYGTSLLRPLFVTLAYKDKLRQAQWIVAERHILPVRIVTVGDAERPASQADLDSVQDQLAAVANDPNLTLVTPHAFDYKFVGANGQVLQITNELELLDQELLDGLMLNKALLNGEGPAYGNAQVGLMSMNERLETWRREVSQWIEEKLFKQEAEFHDFYASGEGGQKELIYPKIVFDDLKLKDNTGILQTMVTAQENGVISAETLVEEMGKNWDQEVERLRFEQGMNFVNSSDIMDTDMNIGFGGVSGQGFGGDGTNQPLTGPEGEPMPPGGNAGAEGAGIPPGSEGGAPPATPGPTANTVHKQYRIAAQTMNEIFYNRSALASIKEQDFISDCDREINEKFAVNGRGIFNEEIIENYEPIEPWNIRGAGIPMNYLAVKQCRFGQVKEKTNIIQKTEKMTIDKKTEKMTIDKKTEKMTIAKKDQQIVNRYTGLERKLYQIIMQMQIPLAFYAQYEAGPGQNYTLDGAFPQIKLGIEADGEIWHTAPKKLEGDKNRDTNLSRQGWTILRFKDKEIEKQPRDVAMVVQQAVQKLMGAYGFGKGQTV